MSVTLSIQGFEFDTGVEIPCPKCGVSLLDSTALRSKTPSTMDEKLRQIQHANCPSCAGYGGPPDEQLPPTPFLMNICNGAAAALCGLLSVDREQEMFEPEVILTYTQEELAAELTRLYKRDDLYSLPSHITDQFPNLTRSTERVAADHAALLFKIAKKAKAYSRLIWMR